MIAALAKLLRAIGDAIDLAPRPTLEPIRYDEPSIAQFKKDLERCGRGRRVDLTIELSRPVYRK